MKQPQEQASHQTQSAAQHNAASDKVVQEERKEHAVLSVREARAQGKLEGFRVLKAQIDAETAVIGDKLRALQTLVERNIKNEQNPNGLLAGVQDEYLGCLELTNLDRLERLLQADEQFWRTNFSVARSQMVTNDELLTSIFSKQAREIEDYLQG